MDAISIIVSRGTTNKTLVNEQSRVKCTSQVLCRGTQTNRRLKIRHNPTFCCILFENVWYKKKINKGAEHERPIFSALRVTMRMKRDFVVLSWSLRIWRAHAAVQTLNQGHTCQLVWIKKIQTTLVQHVSIIIYTWRSSLSCFLSWRKMCIRDMWTFLFNFFFCSSTISFEPNVIARFSTLTPLHLLPSPPPPAPPPIWQS